MFNWVDAANIGEAASVLLCNFDQYKNQGLDITGNELMIFQDVAVFMSNKLERPIKYEERFQDTIF